MSAKPGTLEKALREQFFRSIKEEFAPRLRELGFKGSGKTFRRVIGEVIQVINLQGDRYGGRCCVNLGLHPTFLPVFSTRELPDPAKLLEMDCELRWRLAPEGRADCWWKYSGWRLTPEKSVRKLIATYEKFGEPKLQQYSTLQSLCELFDPANLQSGEWLDELGGIATPRVALMMAQVHAHQGNTALAKEYARIGLEFLGNASLVRPELEKLLDSNA